MAIKLPSTSATIKVVIRQDSALDTTDEQYEKYLETNDESYLKFVEGQEPTRFVLRKVLRADAAAEVMNKQIKMVGNKMEFQLGYMIDEVRMSLVDIENPASVPDQEKIIFKRDSDGGASQDIVSALHAIGAVMNLWQARQAVTQTGQGLKGDELKKKSEL